MTLSTDNIYPLIVPADYFRKGVWELPHHSFPNQSFILTWVTFGTSKTMAYLTTEQYQELNSSHLDWQQKSFENLRLSIAENENFFTQFKMSADGQQLLFIFFMNADGIGSSRILLSTELTKAFPNGYYLAFPDRSCGLVIAKDINDNELKQIKKTIKDMYKKAATFMSGEVHSAHDFILPENWTQPIDTSFSALLINEILKLKG